MKNNQSSWEIIELPNRLTKINDKVYFGYLEPSSTDLTEYEPLTPNDILKEVLKCLISDEESSLENLLDEYRFELDALGIGIDYFKEVNVIDRAFAPQYAKLSLPTGETSCVKSLIEGTREEWGEISEETYEHYQISESEYEERHQEEIQYLSRLAAEYGFQLIPV